MPCITAFRQPSQRRLLQFVIVMRGLTHTASKQKRQGRSAHNCHVKVLHALICLRRVIQTLPETALRIWTNSCTGLLWTARTKGKLAVHDATLRLTAIRAVILPADAGDPSAWNLAYHMG